MEQIYQLDVDEKLVLEDEDKQNGGEPNRALPLSLKRMQAVI